MHLHSCLFRKAVNNSAAFSQLIHDTNLNAAYVARLLSEMGDVCASYSYWTFGDVFEEAGVAYTPFSGCFGLLTNGMIPKPTYYTFSFFRNIGTNAIARDENFIVTKDNGDKIKGIAWNPVEENENSDLSLKLTIDLENGEYLLITKLVDEETCNPVKNWIDMGTPSNPSKEQIEFLKECARPQVKTSRFRVANSTAEIDLSLTSNALCYFEIQRITPNTDRGYQPERIRGAI
jgi:xylan 1,4-beta-xylosidase